MDTATNRIVTLVIGLLIVILSTHMFGAESPVAWMLGLAVGFMLIFQVVYSAKKAFHARRPKQIDENLNRGN